MRDNDSTNRRRLNKIGKIKFIILSSSICLLTACALSAQTVQTVIVQTQAPIQTSIAQTQAVNPTSIFTPVPPTSPSTNIPTPTSTHTPIPTSTSTPNQTAIAFSKILETATAQAGWKPKLFDTFGDNVFGWCNMRSVATREDGAKNRFYFDNGVYHITYTSGEKYSQLWCAPYGTYYDFQVSVLAKFISGDPETSYGVAFRVYQQSFKGFSRFIINPANEYRVDTRDSNGVWEILQDWTKSNDMKPQGEWNKITISAIGPELTFFINDRFQTYLIYRGADAEKGSIGLVVHGEIPGKSIDVLFDDLTIREP